MKLVMDLFELLESFKGLVQPNFDARSNLALFCKFNKGNKVKFFSNHSYIQCHVLEFDGFCSCQIQAVQLQKHFLLVRLFGSARHPKSGQTILCYKQKHILTALHACTASFNGLSKFCVNLNTNIQSYFSVPYDIRVTFFHAFGFKISQNKYCSCVFPVGSNSGCWQWAWSMFIKIRRLQPTGTTMFERLRERWILDT